MSPDLNEQSRQRDSMSLRIIGTFFVFFSVLVMIGTFWENRPRAMAVNLATGFVSLLIGCGMAAYGYRLRLSGKNR